MAVPAAVDRISLQDPYITGATSLSSALITSDGDLDCMAGSIRAEAARVINRSSNTSTLATHVSGQLFNSDTNIDDQDRFILNIIRERTEQKSRLAALELGLHSVQEELRCLAQYRTYDIVIQQQVVSILSDLIARSKAVTVVTESDKTRTWTGEPSDCSTLDDQSLSDSFGTLDIAAQSVAGSKIERVLRQRRKRDKILYLVEWKKSWVTEQELNDVVLKCFRDKNNRRETWRH
jgi:hypothetical protein